MKKFLCILMATFLGFCIPAMAEKPTQDQRAELKKLVETCRATSSIAESCIETLRVATKPPPLPEWCVTVMVDYTLTPAEIAKGYDQAPDFIENGDFQAVPRSKGKVKREICLIKFPEPTSTEDAKAKIEACGEFLVADLWELNAIGTEEPDLQFKINMVALGSRWRSEFSGVIVPTLFGGYHDRAGDMRCLGHNYLIKIWPAPIRFVVVRK